MCKVMYWLKYRISISFLEINLNETLFSIFFEEIEKKYTIFLTVKSRQK